MFPLRLSRSTLGLVIFAVLALIVLLLSSVRVGGTAADQVPRGKPQKDDKPAPAVPLDVQGQLQDNDAVDPVKGEPCKTYMVKLKKGKAYAIDMASTDFDSYLRLEDAKGKQLAEDDDSGGRLNAQIVFNPDADGNFKVIATRLGNSGTGNFTLKVQAISFKVGKAHALKNGELKIADKLTEKDTGALGALKSPHKVHTVKLRAGKAYTIDMASGDFDTYLRLMDPQLRTIAIDDDGGGGTDSRIRFSPTTDGEYHIVATTFDGGTGEYTLTVKEEQ